MHSCVAPSGNECSARLELLWVLCCLTCPSCARGEVMTVLLCVLCCLTCPSCAGGEVMTVLMGCIIGMMSLGRGAPHAQTCPCR